MIGLFLYFWSVCILCANVFILQKKAWARKFMLLTLMFCIVAGVVYAFLSAKAGIALLALYLLGCLAIMLFSAKSESR